VIVGVLYSIGVPALKGFIDRRATLEIAREFSSAVRLAKSEAMKRGEQATICARDPNLTQQCQRSGGDWSGGWLVYIDRGSRGQFEPAIDQLLQDRSLEDSAVPILATLGSITFRSTGVQVGFASRFQFRPPGAKAGDAFPPGSRLVCVNKTGRPRPLPQDKPAC